MHFRTLHDMSCWKDGRVGFIDFGIVGRIPLELKLAEECRGCRGCILILYHLHTKNMKQSQDIHCIKNDILMTSC